MTKYVFVTGGLVGSTGKGIATASIERVPKSRIVSGTLQKLLPDLDVDLDMLRSKIDKYDISESCPADGNTGRNLKDEKD
jgi:hypothetical protein